MIHAGVFVALTVLNVAAAPPNFVLIITDDISHDDLGCYGNPVVKTPNLDRMAASGLQFTNAYLTCSSCSPSRCSLITGRYPHNTGACELHVPLPDGHVLFPELLQQAGYYTALSGKHHMGPNVNHAFDLISPGKPPGKQGDWVQLLRERPQDRPFFFWFAAGDAHRSWSRSDEAPTYSPDEIQPPDYLVNGPLTRQDLADYYHEVSRTDVFAGRVVAELQRQGVAESTYLIYMSDNGRPFPRCKTRLYDSGIKSPLIIYAPGQVKPRVIDSLISVNIDLGPTILRLAGIKPDARMQGVSFDAMLTDSIIITRDVVFAEQNWHVMQAHQRMVRHGNWVYIRNNYPDRQAMCVESSARFPAGKELWEAEAAGALTPFQRDVFLNPRPAAELYQIADDPNQFRNLAGNPDYDEVCRYLQAALDQWTQETHDSIPEDPTRDREDAAGNKYPQWQHREQPGVNRGSLDSSASGPVWMRDVPNVTQ